jgi:hypothetical protein
MGNGKTWVEIIGNQQRMPHIRFAVAAVVAPLAFTCDLSVKK